MFKKFNKEESSDEEETQSFSFKKTTPTKPKGKSIFMSNWLKSSKNGAKEIKSKSNAVKDVDVDINNFKDKTEENTTIDDLLDSFESDGEDNNKAGKSPKPVDKKEILAVRYNSPKKNSSIYNAVSEHVENYFSDKDDDEDIKVVNEMSLSPLENSYNEKIPGNKGDDDSGKKLNKGELNFDKSYKIPKNKVDDNNDSGNKLKRGELNFDRKIKSATKNDTGAKPKETVVGSIFKKGSSSSTSSEEPTENKVFKFPSHLKPLTENKRKRVAHVPKSKSKESNKKQRGSSVFDDDSDDDDISKKAKSGSSIFEDDNDCDGKVQKTGSSIFDYEDPPDVVKLNAKRRQSMAKMAKRSGAKGGKKDSIDSEEELIKKPAKRKPRRKKSETDEKQKNINEFFQATPGPGHSPLKRPKKPKPSPTKRDSDEDSDEECNDEYVPDLDELLKMPERPADGSKTVDEMCDEMDKQIAEKQKAHEEEMEKVDIDIETMKRKRAEKKARMKENAKRRNILETELTELKLRELFNQNLEYLQGVWIGKVESSRHKAFHQSIRTRHALYYMMITDPFTDQQLDWTLDEIEKVWMKTKEEHRKNNEYVWKVLLAECFIKFYMDTFQVTKDEAVQMISETPLHKKDRLKDMRGSDESDTSDSD